MLRFLTAGESHGKCLVGILEGIPADLSLKDRDINYELRRRQYGYGRGGRMKIEKDKVEILSGVRYGKTLGTPIALLIKNKDWRNWQEIMAIEEDLKESVEPVTFPRPGHADLAGALKFNQYDMRNILERASARETAMRVAIGAIIKKLLQEFGIRILSYVVQIGRIKIGLEEQKGSRFEKEKFYLSQGKRAEKSVISCPDKKAEDKMIAEIKDCIKRGDTIGGIFEIVCLGVPPGLGSFTHWDKRLDTKLSAHLMSIPAIKGVEIGAGFKGAEIFGSSFQDEIFYDKSLTTPLKFYRLTNNAGGLEGGVTNGEPLLLRAVMKPISTLGQPLQSVDIKSKKKVKSFKERADVCAVPAAAVIGEAVVAIEIGNALLEKFGGDSLKEIKRNYQNYLKEIEKF